MDGEKWGGNDRIKKGEATTEEIKPTAEASYI